MKVIKKDKEIYIEFRKKIYEYDEEKKTFKSIVYPESKEMSEYRKHWGLSTVKVKDYSTYFGDNTLDIPIPNFV